MKQFSVLGVCGVAIALVMLGGCGGKSNGTDGGEDDGGQTGECQVDNSSLPDNGQLDPVWELKSGTPSSFNYICPVKDEDYFWFKTVNPGTILSVHLWNNVTYSQIDLCYAIIPDSDHNQTLGTKCSGDVQGQIDLHVAHYIADRGTYFIKVWANNGKEDRNNPYLIQIDQVVDPDENEPNNDKAHATLVTAGPPAKKGWISYLGDQDWFKIDVTGTDKMLSIGLTTGGHSDLNVHYDVYQPGVPDITLLNSGDKYDAINAITINDMLALPQAGTYYIVITDKENDDSSTTIGYTLTLNLLPNPDINDRTATGNNAPAYATPLTSGVSISNAYIASRGDQDWYKISSSGVSLDAPKLLEVEVTFNNSSAVLQPAALLFVADPNTTCSQDSECGVLTIDCDNRACFTGECTGNKCRGGGLCLPYLSSKRCAIDQLVMRSAPENWRADFTVSANPRHLKTVTPMYGNDYYILVKDFQDQNFDSTTQPYTITVKVIDEPDHPNEINSLYLPYVDDNQDKLLRHESLKYAKDATCTQISPTEYDCSITGYLSFRGDQDWYNLKDIKGIPEVPIIGDSAWKDWNLYIKCENQASNTDVSFEVFTVSDLRTPKRSDHQQGVGYVEIGGTTNDCSYLCGEYDLSGSDYVILRVQHSNRTQYNYTYPYIITIKATLECPHNCGWCNPYCHDYPCPNPGSQTGGTSNCNPWP